uniref:AlNc14C1G49 protein n=1 Tax=Albugo laibachii Nc14 TaxID=890382 RepID=F0VYP7_9STRA|nr:AlNc14C1G49 [Albugo laibachii Nc14]|eukprot:CCA13911.1 AlNc14C1G49 [Albugo laibachii Nc14]
MLIVVLVTVSQAAFAYCIFTSTSTWNKKTLSLNNLDDVAIREEGVYPICPHYTTYTHHNPYNTKKSQRKFIQFTNSEITIS